MLTLLRQAPGEKKEQKARKANELRKQQVIQ